VLQVSALKLEGLDAFWSAASRFREQQAKSGRFEARRQEQNQAWMWERIEAGLKSRFREHPRVREALPGKSAEVKAGRLAPSVAARRLLDLSK
jgi:LAO/AO transport system kinase